VCSHGIAAAEFQRRRNVRCRRQGEHGLRVGTVTIASGQSLSGSIDLGAGQFVSVIKPNGCTAANLTFSGVDR